MRDLRRMKEKFEVSLDSGQVIMLGVVGVLVVGGAFGLGLLVGRKQGAGQAVAAAAGGEDPLAALDRKIDEDPLAAADASLTFHEELTRKQPAVVVVAPVEVPRREPAPRPAEPAPVNPEPAAPEHVLAVAGAPASKPERPTPEASKPRLDDAFAKVASPAAEPVATRIATGDAGLLKDAIARSQRPVEAAADGAWTLQIAAYQDKAEAEKMAALLRDKGYAPFVIEAQVQNKGQWYRVRMGRFPSKDAAGRYLADFKRETAISAIVTSSN